MTNIGAKLRYVDDLKPILVAWFGLLSAIKMGGAFIRQGVYTNKYGLGLSSAAGLVSTVGDGHY